VEAIQRSNLSAIESFFIKSGKITAVRKWKGNNMHEIDIHLPNVDFEKWNKAQSIKCRISALHYTDYTPAMWDANEKTCTLYIDTSHNGQGSIWAKNQVAGNDFHYLKIEDAKHFPIEGKHLVFWGDQTAIKNVKISGIITFNEWQTADEFYENCTWLLLQAVSNNDDIYKETELWLKKHQSEKDNLVFYVVGGAKLVVTLRKLLKTYGIDGNQIKSKGFWQ